MSNLHAADSKCASSAEADHTAGDSGTRVAGLERFVVAASAQIIGLFVKHTGATNDAEWAMQADELVLMFVPAIAVSVSLHIAEVTDVADLILGACMSHLVRVVMRSSGGAALGQIAILVDVEAVLLARGQPCEIAND